MVTGILPPGNQPVYASASAMRSCPHLFDSAQDSGAKPFPQTALATCRLAVGLRARCCDRSRSEWDATKGPMCVVEYVPADRASTSLVIEDQFSNLRGESFRLRLPFPGCVPPQVSPADTEAPTALIAFAAAPRSWAATCAAALATKAARRASPMPTSPLTTRDRHRWRGAVG